MYCAPELSSRWNQPAQQTCFFVILHFPSSSCCGIWMFCFYKNCFKLCAFILMECQLCPLGLFLANLADAGSGSHWPRMTAAWLSYLVSKSESSESKRSLEFMVTSFGLSSRAQSSQHCHSLDLRGEMKTTSYALKHYLDPILLILYLGLLSICLISRWELARAFCCSRVRSRHCLAYSWRWRIFSVSGPGQMASTRYSPWWWRNFQVCWSTGCPRFASSIF